jgi:subtilisin-like proprotein convertase family protein
MPHKDIFGRKNLSTSNSNNTKPSTKNNETLVQSSSIRIALFFALLTGLLVIVAGSGAQNLLKRDLSNKLIKTEIPAKSSKRTPNFDVRLGGAGNLESLLQKSSRRDAESVISQTAEANKANIETAFASLKAEQPNAEAEASMLTGAVEIVRNPDGLTKAAPGRTGEEIVREFISNNRGLYGLDDNEIDNLNFIGESIAPESGLRMVRVEQIINGRPVFQSETRFILDREGIIVRSLGLMVPNASAAAEALENLLSPQDALQRTMAQFNVSLDVQTMSVVKSENDGLRTEIRVDNPNIGGAVTSKLVYFPAAPGILIPAWSQIVFGVKEDWYVLVDARDGTQLWRKNIRSDASTHDARFRVYVQADGITPADNPAPQSPSGAAVGAGTQFTEIAPSIVSMFLAQNLTASPNGWIDDCPGGVCTATQTQTLGNNALACADRTSGASNVCDTAGVSVLDGNGRPTGNTDVNGRDRDFLGTAVRDFQTGFLPAPQGGNPEAGTTSSTAVAGTAQQFLRASVAQQFYVTNWYHDKLFALGFNTAAANFQNNNFGGGGTGNDRVFVDIQDGQSVNNANFSTPPDGTSGRAQMFNFTGPTIDRDGGLDNEILIHELTHGTSNRLVGNGAGLQWDVGAGMGEGWSDFYALSLLNNTNADNPNGNYASGAYATYKLAGFAFLDNYVYGIRRFPYSTNNAVNPLTWADVDQSTYNQSGGVAVNPLGFEFGGAMEVHNVGEIWANTLWEMRSRIIAANAGVVPTGNQIALQLVTDGLKMTPINPTFTQARDAIIDADCASNACANEQSIWDAFADRGLGYGAYAPIAVQFGIQSGHLGLRESTQAPNLDLNSVTVSDTIGNSSGFIDPNEPVRLAVNIKNPWRQSTKTATGVSVMLTTSTAGVTILGGSTTYPNIAPNSNANKNLAADNLAIKAPAAAACGGNLNFTLTITSSLGVIARNFSIRMGQPSGTLAPVTYTRSAVALAIPDGNGSGAIDTLTVTDDYQIADVNVRIDSLTHTWDGDVTAGIRGPNGYGTDLLTLTGWFAGGVFQNFGSPNDNFVNTIFDDEAANDIISATNATAPYTNSYKPAFNSTNWVPLLGANPDATPQLSRFDGTSTLGQWKMVVSDHSTPDAGTLQGWSLIVTPQNFVCTPFSPTAANVSVSGMVTDAEGRAISRATVSLTDSQGVTRYARSNSFGYFRFDEVASGQIYTLDAQAKGYSFVSQVVSVADEIAGLNLSAQ